MISAIGAKLKQGVRHSPIFPVLRPRRFHAFCLGAPKTGTASVAAMFRDRYIAEHEPMAAGTPDLILAAYQGRMSHRKLGRALRYRDRELYLEMESSHPMAVFAELLGDVFPRAKFILTFREPRAWLDSIINQHLNYTLHSGAQHANGRDAFYAELRNIYHARPGTPYLPGERILQQHGLYPLDGYLGAWAAHNRRVVGFIPSGRLLLVPTEAIHCRIPDISRFIGVPSSTLHGERAHSHRAPERHDLLSQIDSVLLEEKIEEHCGVLYRQLLTGQ